MLTCDDFVFSTLKHHLSFIRSWVQELAVQSPKGSAPLDSLLLSIGSSQIDIYIGTLKPHEIIALIKKQLEERDILTRDSYFHWLQTNGTHYRLLQLPDQSKWTMLRGQQSNTYIHIHPAKKSPHSIRIHGNTLKTLIAMAYHQLTSEQEPITLFLINHIRHHYFGLSPLKRVSPDRGLLKAWQWFWPTNQKFLIS